MSRGPWKRDVVTGFSLTFCDRLDDVFLKEDGTFDETRYPDCDLFGTRNIAAAAGFSDSRNFVDNVITDASSPFHLRKIDLTDEYDVLIRTIDATHTNSAETGRARWEVTKAARRKERDRLLLVTSTSSRYVL